MRHTLRRKAMKPFGVAQKRDPSRPHARRLAVASLEDSHRRIEKSAIRQILRGPSLQAMLTVGSPGDAFEQGADRAAGDIMHISQPIVQHRRILTVPLQPCRLQFKTLPVERRYPTNSLIWGLQNPASPNSPNTEY